MKTPAVLGVPIACATLAVILCTPAAAVTRVTRVGNMQIPRASHTATLLLGGKVVIAGGASDFTELFDPATGLFTLERRMLVTRAGHTATLLPSGKVLITGGPDASAELYEPDTRLFRQTGNMRVDRVGHTATLLPSGKVLVVGGSLSTDGDIVELYDPAAGAGAGAFSFNGRLLTARRSHTATLLPDGTVLIVGGFNDAGALSSAELYNPAAVTAGPTTSPSVPTTSLTFPRGDHSATLLADGRVLIAGGFDGAGNARASAELYHPATRSMSATGPLTAARGAHTATPLPDGTVLVAGGFPSALRTDSALDSVEIYRPTPFPLVGDFVFGPPMGDGRGDHAAVTLVDGRVLVTGGVSRSGVLASAEVFSIPTPGGVFVAAGNLGASSLIITGAGGGSSPLVRIFKSDNTDTGMGFFAYDPAFTGGVRVASCNTGASGDLTIVTAPGPGGGPHVRVWRISGTSVRELAGFFAYAPAFTGGVHVACGDVDGSGQAAIITGADAGGGPHVRVFQVSATTVRELAGFFAYTPAFTGGVRVAAADLDGDHQADIITGAGPGGGPHVRALKVTGTTVTDLGGFFAYDPGFTGGVFVAGGNGGEGPEIITGAGAGGGPHVRVFRVNQAALPGFFAYEATFRAGVTVAAGKLNASGGLLIVTGTGPGSTPRVRGFTDAGAPTATSFRPY
jgi:WD40 repeat protein